MWDLNWSRSGCSDEAGEGTAASMLGIFNDELNRAPGERERMKVKNVPAGLVLSQIAARINEGEDHDT